MTERIMESPVDYKNGTGNFRNPTEIASRKLHKRSFMVELTFLFGIMTLPSLIYKGHIYSLYIFISEKKEWAIFNDMIHIHVVHFHMTWTGLRRILLFDPHVG